MSAAPKHAQRSSEGAFGRLGSDLAKLRQTKLKIEKNVPIPHIESRRGNAASPLLLALRAMQVGDSVKIPAGTTPGALSSCRRGALPFMFTRHGERIWRTR